MLKGKRAVVTGSTSGIGLGIAKSLAAAGTDLVLNGSRAPNPAVNELRAGIEREFGVRAVYCSADLSSAAHVRELVAVAERELGGVDILVNNAGIQHVAPVEEFPDDKWEKLIALNLSSAFYAIKAALPGMKQRNWGRIVNIASAHALVASPFKSAYVASKHGLLGLTKSVALETADFDITCNAICPGYVRHAARGGTDRRSGEGPQAFARAGDSRRDPRGAAEKALCRGGGAGCARGASVQRRG